MAGRTSADDPESTGSHSQFKKFCRACTDFKTWTKPQTTWKNGDKNQTNNEENPNKGTIANDTQEVRSDCPLEKDELGRNTWSFLHTMAAYYPEKPTVDQREDMEQFIKLFAKFYPCHVCAKDMREKLQQMSPKTSSQRELSQWFCRLHNSVNVKLDKPEFDCSLVNERWKEGYKDGSCN